jgi:hypothetical protein
MQEISSCTQVDRAFEVDVALDKLGIDLTEAEYAQLLAACVAGGAPWTRAKGVLTRMGRELTTLQVLTWVLYTRRGQLSRS